MCFCFKSWICEMYLECWSLDCRIFLVDLGLCLVCNYFVGDFVRGKLLINLSCFFMIVVMGCLL